ncbi:DUF3284 domain-containing protein [Streptococcus castoreus]|uniref:DUF3284 domain-containing protein n=1 Tax=Streptococcus castoreus TaxID=254786 RepID=UPI0004152B59|nr:DUF3284 domain-containing protein [Streptococcus castoreus]
MIISTEGDISINQCFEAIRRSLQDDYRQNTLKQLPLSDLKEGLSYTKRYGKHHEHTVKVLVTAFEVPSLYAARFSSNRGIKELSYYLEALGEHRTRITYQYEMKAVDFFQKVNQLIMGKLFKKSLERQSHAQLAALIQYAKQLS